MIWSSLKEFSHSNLLGCLEYSEELVARDDVSDE